MAIPFNFILSGVMAMKDIVSSFVGVKSPDDKFKKVEDFFHEQNKINALQGELNKQHEQQLNYMQKRIKKLELALVIMSLGVVGFAVYVLK